MTEPNDSLLAVATTRVAVHNEWLASMKGISKTLDSIHAKSKSLYSKVSDRIEFSPVLVTEINTEIIKLNTLLKKNEKEIAALNAKLKGARAWNESMEDSISSLNTELAEKHAELMEVYDLYSGLNDRFYSMEATLHSLYTQNAIQNMTIVRDIKEAKTGYYAIGSIKELQQKNIIKKEGIVPGFRSSAINSRLDLSKFAKIDIREKKEFVINSKHTKLLSLHTTAAYKFEKDNGKTIRLVITDPGEFWRISKYLVIATD